MSCDRDLDLDHHFWLSFNTQPVSAATLYQKKVRQVIVEQIFCKVDSLVMLQEGTWKHFWMLDSLPHSEIVEMNVFWTCTGGQPTFLTSHVSSFLLWVCELLANFLFLWILSEGNHKEFFAWETFPSITSSTEHLGKYADSEKNTNNFVLWLYQCEGTHHHLISKDFEVLSSPA